jgi:two-component system OmpR family response regulator
MTNEPWQLTIMVNYAAAQRISASVDGGLRLRPPPRGGLAQETPQRGTERTMRILVIEDNPDVARSVQQVLEDHPYEVDIVNTGYDGEAKAASGAYGMIILDLMLPDRDGIDICKVLRRHKVDTPILMLTSLAATEHKVDGLKAGADDYLTKPFAPEELLARIEAIGRRMHGEQDSTLTFGGITMDLLKRQVVRETQPIRLTMKEFELLEHFLRNPHRVLSKSQLGARVWDINHEEDSNVIEVYISRLRKKVDQPFEKQLIHTMVGAGYMLSDEPPAR